MSFVLSGTASALAYRRLQPIAQAQVSIKLDISSLDRSRSLANSR